MAEQFKHSDNPVLVAGAESALSKFKYDVANGMNISIPQGGYWGNVSSRDCGAIGGQMVKRMIQMAETQLQQQTR